MFRLASVGCDPLDLDMPSFIRMALKVMDHVLVRRNVPVDDDQELLAIRRLGGFGGHFMISN